MGATVTHMNGRTDGPPGIISFENKSIYSDIMSPETIVYLGLRVKSAILLTDFSQI